MIPSLLRRARAALLLALTPLVALAAASCGDGASTADSVGSGSGTGDPLRMSAIPDRDPNVLVDTNTAMAEYLSGALGVGVEYVPVTDYAASVSLFKAGDVDMVFFGGLTGVQARLQAPGATLLAQRDIDDAFRSVFIASTGSGIEPVDAVEGLTVLRGARFTFGSESSTSGRMMPEYFLDQAGLSSEEDFAGPPGFSGSHDKTVDLVEAGAYEVGALNNQVWEDRVAEGTVDLAKVVAVLITPTYRDYQWIAGPNTDDRFGDGFTERLSDALLELDYDEPEDAALLDMYGAKSFIPTSPDNYQELEQIGRKLGLIS